MKRKRQIIEVEWIDSATHDAWARINVAFSTGKCRTVGYKVRETKRFLSLSGSLGGKPLNACQTISIPKACITNRKVH